MKISNFEVMFFDADDERKYRNFLIYRFDKPTIERIRTIYANRQMSISDKNFDFNDINLVNKLARFADRGYFRLIDFKPELDGEAGVIYVAEEQWQDGDSDSISLSPEALKSLIETNIYEDEYRVVINTDYNFKLHPRVIALHEELVEVIKIYIQEVILEKKQKELDAEEKERAKYKELKKKYEGS